MIIDLLKPTSDYYLVKKLIAELRQSYMDNGGTVEGFTEYLEFHGIVVRRTILTIDEKWNTYIKLKE